MASNFYFLDEVESWLESEGKEDMWGTSKAKQVGTCHLVMWESIYHKTKSGAIIASLVSPMK